MLGKVIREKTFNVEVLKQLFHDVPKQENTITVRRAFSNPYQKSGGRNVV